jgi:RNA polymerase sigma-70 factor (ECF subfamily)
LNGLDDPARFDTWAYRIVTRRCALGIRRQRRRREVEREVAAMHIPVTAPECQAAVSAVDAVRVALRKLPAEQRVILELRYVDDFGIKQIAEALGIAVGTVKSRLFYAREHLRDILAKVTQ